MTKLFAERLQAWKHAVAYLEDYVTATEKTNHAHGKEYERVLKVSRSQGRHKNTLIRDRLSRILLRRGITSTSRWVVLLACSRTSDPTLRYALDVLLDKSLSNIWLGYLEPTLRDCKAAKERNSPHLRTPTHRDQEQEQGAYKRSWEGQQGC